MGSIVPKHMEYSVLPTTSITYIEISQKVFIRYLKIKPFWKENTGGINIITPNIIFDLWAVYWYNICSYTLSGMSLPRGKARVFPRRGPAFPLVSF